MILLYIYIYIIGDIVIDIKTRTNRNFENMKTWLQKNKLNINNNETNSMVLANLNIGNMDVIGAQAINIRSDETQL